MEIRYYVKIEIDDKYLSEKKAEQYFEEMMRELAKIAKSTHPEYSAKIYRVEKHEIITM